mmetsp:Transcript_6887/g.15144  ORF Transcript_6887/g.15144 Transcript_6887/m.15144 type:complete len:105 (-) Transcript_6887:1538-1852(-)
MHNRHSLALKQSPSNYYRHLGKGADLTKNGCVSIQTLVTRSYIPYMSSLLTMVVMVALTTDIFNGFPLGPTTMSRGRPLSSVLESSSKTKRISFLLKPLPFHGF